MISLYHFFLFTYRTSVGPLISSRAYPWWDPTWKGTNYIFSREQQWLTSNFSLSRFEQDGTLVGISVGMLLGSLGLVGMALGVDLGPFDYMIYSGQWVASHLN